MCTCNKSKQSYITWIWENSVYNSLLQSQVEDTVINCVKKRYHCADTVAPRVKSSFRLGIMLQSDLLQDAGGRRLQVPIQHKCCHFLKLFEWSFQKGSASCTAVVTRYCLGTPSHTGPNHVRSNVNSFHALLTSRTQGTSICVFYIIHGVYDTSSYTVIGACSPHLSHKHTHTLHICTCIYLCTCIPAHIIAPHFFPLPFPFPVDFLLLFPPLTLTLSSVLSTASVATELLASASADPPSSQDSLASTSSLSFLVR